MKHDFLLLLLHFITPFHCFSFTDRSVRERKCEPVTIAPCRQIGYNMTRALDMYSPIARNIEKGRKYIHMLGQTSCSKHAVFLLCTLYSPVCFKDIQEIVLPCQSVCYKVKKRCGLLMKKYGIEWPEEMNCETLPEHNTGVCIQPSSFLSADKGPAYRSQKDRWKEKRPKECVCKKQQILSKFTKYRHYRKASFVIEGTIISRATTAHGRTKIYMNVTRVLKAGKVKPRMGKNKIWAPTTCVCPKFQYDEKYIMLGSENAERQRLEFNANDRLLPFQVGEEKLRRWVAKCKKRRCMKS